MWEGRRGRDSLVRAFFLGEHQAQVGGLTLSLLGTLSLLSGTSGRNIRQARARPREASVCLARSTYCKVPPGRDGFFCGERETLLLHHTSAKHLSACSGRASERALQGHATDYGANEMAERTPRETPPSGEAILPFRLRHPCWHLAECKLG